MPKNSRCPLNILSYLLYFMWLNIKILSTLEILRFDYLVVNFGWKLRKL